jgi:hypothetical protein
MLMKNARLLIPAICMCCVLIAAAWSLGFIPTYAEYCEKNPQTNYEECATYHIALIALWQIVKFLNYISAPLTTFATVAIGVFTYTLKKATDRLWEAGERQRKLSEDTAKRQLRAYLLPKGGTMYVPDMNHTVITFINNGQTPAYNVGTYSGHAVVDFPLPDSAIFSMTGIEHGGFGDIGAAGERNIESFFTLSPEDKDAISNRTKAIFFWGKIEYLDIFKGETHTTEFRFYYGGDVCSPDGRLTIDKGGNQST